MTLKHSVTSGLPYTEADSHWYDVLPLVKLLSLNVMTDRLQTNIIGEIKGEKEKSTLTNKKNVKK